MKPAHCGYCGHRGTFAEVHQHVRACPKHPIAALRLLMACCRAPDESHNDSYQRAADAFHRATGLTAPGVSRPLEMGTQNVDEAEVRWREWNRDRWAEAWAAAEAALK